jgi:hypothetical protein
MVGGMKRTSLFALSAIFFLALYLRMFPLTETIYWGADYGEYFFLSRELAVSGHMSSQYLGWGLVYPDFPGMEILSSSMSILSNSSLEMWVSLVAPFLSSLVVIFIFLLAYEIFRDERIGLVAATFVAVVLPHVYATSHPMPGSVGDLMLVVGLLLFVKMQRNPRMIYPLTITAVALVMTHHLSTYILLICVMAGVFLKVIFTKNSKLGDFKISFTFLAIFTAVILLYWSLAPNFKDKILSHLFPWWIFLLIIPAALAILAIFVHLRSRIAFAPKLLYPSFKTSVSYFIIILSTVLIIQTVLVVIGIPGTTMMVKASTLVVYLPLVVFISLSGFGFDYWKFYKNGTYVTGYLIAIVGSLLFGALFAPTILIPYRHLEYLVLPLSLFVGLGLVYFHDIWTGGGHSDASDPMIRNAESRGVGRGKAGRANRKTAAIVSIAVFLLIANSFSSFPSRDHLLGYEEGTGSKSMEGIAWLDYKTSKDSTVASDHRLSSMIFGFSERNSTWDLAPQTLTTSSFEDAQSEMSQIVLPSGTKRIDYVMLDEDVKTGAILLVWDVAEPLSQEALDKFEGSNYTKLFDNGFSQIYMVNW